MTRGRAVAALAALVAASAALSGAQTGARVLAKLPPDDGTLLVLNKWSETLTAYDPNTGHQLAELAVGSVPHEMVLSADRKTLYISNYGVRTYTDAGPGANTVSIVDVVNGKKAGEISLDDARRPHGIALGKSGRLYVTVDAPAAVLVLDPAARKVVARHPVDGKLPHMLAVSRDEKAAYVAASGSGTVVALRLDGKAGATRNRAVQVGGTPMGLTLSPDDRRLYVTNRDGNALVVIDTAGMKVASRVPMPGAPARVERIPGQDLLAVTLIEAGDVALVDTGTLSVVARRHVGERAEGLFVEEHGRFLCVSAQAENKVVKYTLGTLERALDIDTGQRPDPVVLIPGSFGFKVGIGGLGAKTLQERDAGVTKLR